MAEIKYKCKKCSKDCIYDDIYSHIYSRHQKFIKQLCDDCYSLHSFIEYGKHVEKNAIVRNAKARCPGCNNITQVVQKEYYANKTEWTGECKHCGSHFETQNVWDIK